MKDLLALSQPFPQKFVKRAPSGHGDYVNQAVVNQKLLLKCGPFSFRILREIYDDDILTGVVAELEIQIDGRLVKIQEAGDCDDDETQEGKKVTKTNGARLKKATSDALKRCAMRIGCGLELWAKDGEYILHSELSKRAEAEKSKDAA